MENPNRKLSSIGAALRRHRNLLGESQLSFSIRTNLSQSNISQAENGQRNLSLASFIYWCRALGVLPSQILKEAGL